MIQGVDRRFGTLLIDQHAASVKLGYPLDLAGGAESLETVDQDDPVVLDANHHGGELPIPLQGTRYGTIRIRIVKTIPLQSFVDPLEIK